MLLAFDEHDREGKMENRIYARKGLIGICPYCNQKVFAMLLHDRWQWVHGDYIADMPKRKRLLWLFEMISIKYN